jgi:dihydroflavonol-4-reductase
MKCVVTGATGHIGYALLLELLGEGYEITALVLPNDDISHIRDLPVKIVYGDVCRMAELAAAFAGAEAVFHLAGIISIGQTDKALLHRVNVEGTRSVIEACRAAGVNKLIYTSSVHAIPEPAGDTVISESRAFSPELVVGDYAKSKAEATALVLRASEAGLHTVVVHPAGVIGPYAYKLSNMGQMIIDFLEGRLTAYIDGAYNFVDVRDVARGIRLAAEKSASGECYILAGGVITVKELLDHVADAAGVRRISVKMPLWLAKATAPLAEIYYKLLRQKPLYTPYSVYTLQSKCRFSSEKAIAQLGYSPRPIALTIRDTVEWIMENYPITVRRKKQGVRVS